MIVIDANLLLYAYDSGSPHHVKARQWLSKVLSGTHTVWLPWQSLAAFLRVATHPKLLRDRYSVEEAAEMVDAWLNQPCVRILAPGERHWNLLRRMMVEGQARGTMLSDAQLAALTMECGGVLYTTDRDFARFPGLRWKNPLT